MAVPCYNFVVEGTILLVDDHPNIRSSLGDYLAREGFEVALAQDGQQALEQFFRYSPDLVILDVQMPKRDGIEVCREIRRQPHYTPIIMISGVKKELVDQVVGLEVGADRYILKPFELPLLAAEVRALLRMAREIHAGGQTEGWLVIDDYLSINRQQRAVRAGEVTPHLTVLEFDLLLYLLDRAGLPCGRDDLIDKVLKPTVWPA